MNQTEARATLVYGMNFIKGICILAVIAIHITAFSFLIPGSQSIPAFAGLINAASRFAIPIFFIFSAFFSALGNRKKRTSSRLIVTLKYLVVPYVIYSIAYSMPEFLAGGLSITRLIAKICTGNASYHLWFLFVVIQFYVLHPFLYQLYQKLIGKLPLLPVLCLVCQVVLNIAAIILASTFSDNVLARKLNLVGHSVFTAIGYIVLGYSLADRSDRFMQWLNSRLNLVTAVILYVVLTFTLWMIWMVRDVSSSPADPVFVVALESISPILGIAMMVLLYAVYQLLNTSGKFVTVISTLGLYTYGCYFIHPFIMVLTTPVMRQLSMMGAGDVVTVFVWYWITVIGTFLVVKLISLLPFQRYLI